MSINLSALKNVKLKSSKTKSQSRPKVTQLLCENTEQYTQLMKESFLEEYMEVINEYTFKSVTVDFPKEAAKEIMRCHKYWLEHHKDKEYDANFFKESELLVELAKQFDEKKKKLTTENFFIRMSSRSPKDAALTSPKFKEEYTNAFQTILENDEKKNDQFSEKNTTINRKIHSLYIASVRALSCKTGMEAIKLLIESKRIQGDLLQYAVEGLFELQFWLREFHFFPVELEMRAFVYKKKLTALTQYNEFVYFPKIERNKSAIMEKVQNFVKQIIQEIPFQNFVLDINPCFENDNSPLLDEEKDFSQLKIYICELNPLAEFAGSGCFDWVKDRDVLTGNSPFEFRIVEKPPQFGIQNIPETWKELIFENEEEKN